MKSRGTGKLFCCQYFNVFLLFLFFHLPVRCDLLTKVGPLCSVIDEIPRLWQSFTNKLLQLVVSKPSVSQENVKQSLFAISKASNKFLLKLYGRVYELPFPKEPGQCLNSPFVSRASATLSVTFFQQCPFCGSHTRLSSCSWNFNLNKHLALNMTFVVIDFFLENLSCSNGHLRIIREIPYVSNGHVFCGKYTIFSLYPNSNEVLIAVFSNRCFYFKIQSFFISMDAKMIWTGEARKSFSEIPAIDHVFLKKTNITVQVFLIQVAKSALAQIQEVDHCKIFVYDGPDINTQQIMPQKQLYQLSTFQGFVLRKQTFKSKCFLLFSGKTLKLKNIFVFKNEMNLSLPTDRCLYNKHLCVISFETILGHQLNASLISVLMKREAITPNCRYCGLSVLINNISSHEGYSTVCQNKSKRSSETFYSSNSTLQFIVYWYFQHIPVHAQLILRSTPCRPVVIDICFSSTLLVGPWHSRKFVLKQKTNSSGLNLRMAMWKSSLFFSIQKDACVVLQILPNQRVVHYCNNGGLSSK